MGTSTSVSEFVGKINNSADRLRKSGKATVGAGAQAAKQIIEAQMTAATGDRRLSGRNNARIGVQYKVFDRRVTVANVRAFGPAHLIERPTAAHAITSKHAGGSRRSRGGRAVGALLGGSATGFRGGRRSVLNIPGIGYRKYAFHPGTKGKYPFRKGAELSQGRVTKIIRTGTVQAVTGAFR